MLKNSIMSYPQRGHWGNSTYRGNCSGFVVKDVIEHFFPNNLPKQFIEVFSGGGTGEDVAKELGLKNSIHLDLNSGWDALKDEIPCKADFVFSHPPYWNIIKYDQYRMEKFENELSSEDDYPNFIQKLNSVNKKIYEALEAGGIHAMLIGDVRKNGTYYSIQKDMVWYGNIISHVIKVQHNTMSNNKKYTNMRFIPIAHEHLLIFKKE